MGTRSVVEPHGVRKEGKDTRVVCGNFGGVVRPERRPQRLLRTALGRLLDVALVRGIEIFRRRLDSSSHTISRHAHLPPRASAPGKVPEGGRRRRRTSEIKSGYIRMVEMPSRWFRTQ